MSDPLSNSSLRNPLAEDETGERPPLDPARLRLPEGVNFNCQHSGRCCQDFWEIPLDPISAQRLKSLPLSSISPKYIDPASYCEPSACRPGQLGMKRRQGRCVFLDGSLRCVVHGQFGAAAKPQACLDFPFMYVCTPGGVFVGLSMACPSVRANRGRPIEEQREELAQNFVSSLAVKTVVEPVLLSEGLPIDFATYERIELCLNEIFSIETLAVDDRLVAGAVFLQLLDRALRELDEPVETASANAARILDLFRNDQYRRVATIARKARSVDRMHRAVMGLVLTYRAAFDGKPRGRMGRGGYLVLQYLRHMGGLGMLRMPPIEGRHWPSRLRAVRTDWNDPYFVYHLLRFCRLSLFRKDAILTTPLIKGYGFLLIYVGLIRWYAKAFAASSGEGEVRRLDLDAAIGAVEKYYCLHSDFMRLFERYPVFRGMIDRLIEKPFFAPSMVRPKGP